MDDGAVGSIGALEQMSSVELRLAMSQPPERARSPTRTTFVTYFAARIFRCPRSDS